MDMSRRTRIRALAGETIGEHSGEQRQIVRPTTDFDNDGEVRRGAAQAVPVESVRRALRILRSFTPERPEVGVSDIARTLGMHKSTTHRLLTTLELEGFVHQTESGRYALSWAVLTLANAIPTSQAIRQHVFDHLRELANRTGETAHLAVLDRGEVLYVEKVEGSWSLRMPSAVGRRVPLHCTALGKVLVAGLDLEERRRLIAAHELHAPTARTITDPATLITETERVRAQGYALDMEEFEQGLVCIAAPICDERRRTCAAISIAGPAPRLLGHLDDRIGDVQATAEALSGALGPHAAALSAAPGGATFAFFGEER